MPKTQESLIQARDISYRYDEKYILKNLSLEIGQGEICILRGPSGSGKSSLLRIIAGDMIPTSGSLIYHLDGQDISTRDRHFTSFYREHIGTFFTESLFFEKNTVRENILFPSMFGGYFFDADFFRVLVEQFEVESLLDTPIRETSSGERERIALIRMFVSRPQILFLDEPFSHLDDRLSEIGQSILGDYIHTHHPTVFLVSHNTDLTFPTARHLFLQDSSLIDI